MSILEAVDPATRVPISGGGGHRGEIAPVTWIEISVARSRCPPTPIRG
jgi:hypothetical protein